MEKSSRSSKRSGEEREKDHKRRHHHRHRDERRNGDEQDDVAAAKDSRRSRDDWHRRHRERSRSVDGDTVRDSVERGGGGGGGRGSAREESVERVSASSRKRKEHGGVAGKDAAGEKRVRVEERRERRRFEDRSEDPRVDGDGVDANGGYRDGGRKKERKFKDRVKEDERVEDRKVKEEPLSEAETRTVERRRERDRVKEEEEEEEIDGQPSKAKVKEEDFGYEEDTKAGVPVSNRRSDKSSPGQSIGDWSPGYRDKSSFGPKAAALEKLNMASEAVPNASASTNYPHPSKVSFTTNNENEGVNITRSDEVPGKSSTDGATTSVSGKSGSLSLDALAKAKKALQMQKELAEKMKKIPMLGKLSSTDTNSQVEVKKEVYKTPSLVPANASSTASIQTKPGPQSSVDAATAVALKSSTVGNVAALSGLTVEAVKRAQEVAARMGFHQDPQFAPLINMFPGPAADVSIAQKPSKAPVLRLDAQGREIDEHGNVINVPKTTNLSTLKVNINKQKKEAFQILRPELDADVESNPHFDERMGINKTKLLRPKRMSFQFVEEGKWSRQAEITRFKSQFGEAQAKELRTKQAQLAKAKAVPDINPNLIEISERVVIKEKQKDLIPEIEWWDLPIVPSGSYSDINKDKLNIEKITIYVEHPLPIQPPAEPAPPPPQPLKLTKKENKKLRTQRRLAKERDRQEMIRQGLIEPPKPKVKMSNLMKVLGTEATQDPTRLEFEIRSAAAEREQAHVDRNIARKLTPAERREKKERKLFEDPNTLETIVTIYRVNHLSHPKARFQVDVNAQENKLTGCAVISDGICVVVVEGVKKSNKRYKNLMLKRIDWSAAVENEEEEADESDAPANKCSLVWQGSVAKASFHRFLVHQCRTEIAARKIFADAGVPHYWDLAVNHSDELV